MPSKVANARNDWRTPQWLFDHLNSIYSFEYDLCASESNALCKHYFTIHNPFTRTQPGPSRQRVHFANPPFSHPEAINVIREIALSGLPTVMLYRNDNPERAVWQDVIFPVCSWIFTPRERIRFDDPSGENRDEPMFSVAIIGLNLGSALPALNIRGAFSHPGSIVAPPNPLRDTRPKRRKAKAKPEPDYSSILA